MSGAVIYLKKDLNISELKVDIVLGVFNFCSLFGSLAGGRICDWIGRRYTIALAGVLFLAGAVLMACSKGYGFLSVGNLACSTGVGFAFMIAPVYAAEVAPASFRGFLPTFPENPRDGSSCRAVSLRLGKSSTEPPTPKPKLSSASPTSSKPPPKPPPQQPRKPPQAPGTLSPPRRHHRSCHILIAGVGINFFRQASGLDVTLLYGPTILEKAGIDADQKLLAMICLGAVKLVFVLVATFLLDQSGRRPLLLCSTVGMILSLLGLAAGLTVIDRWSHQKLTWAIGLCVTTILSNTAFFSIGLGPITWVYTSEIFRLRLRGVGASIAVAVNRLSSGIIVLTFT
ncbi:Putative polyol transporter 2 [Morus notabilis]|uniref:Putative polyol transporter 2 n=1 Tax=Morus notabilis TaxID=981085 RepID=W9R0Z5_9ROSA|nr:putative polyol transporter 2 [Morus notabilis]EXB63595.1 Putative polyol transporter 2 [Morus notabilis]